MSFADGGVPDSDTLITSENKIYGISENPLNPLIELIHGISEPKPTKYNQDSYTYRYMGGIPNPFNFWSRRYKAKWLIEDDKFYLTKLEGEIYGTKLAPHVFYFRHYLDPDNNLKELATWYTGKLTADSSKFQIIEQTKFLLRERIIYQIEKGIVLSSESETFQEKYIEPPF